MLSAATVALSSPFKIVMMETYLEGAPGRHERRQLDHGRLLALAVAVQLVLEREQRGQLLVEFLACKMDKRVVGTVALVRHEREMR